jgi:hypothetical protein
MLEPVSGSILYDNGDFIVSHSSDAYAKNFIPLGNSFVNKGPIFWLKLDAADSHSLDVYRRAIVQGAIKNGAPAYHAERFVQAVGEGIENILRHGYNFERGKILNLHVRLTPMCDVASLSGYGRVPNFETIDSAVTHAKDYIQRAAALNDALNNGSKSREEIQKEASELLRGTHGKGIKDMIARCDYLRCEYNNGQTIWMLLMLRPDAINGARPN